MNARNILETGRQAVDRLKAMDRKKLTALSIATVALFAGGVALLVRGGSAPHAMAPRETPLAVRTLVVEPGTVTAVVSASGALASKNSSVLSSKVMGTVVHVGAQEGEYVPQGTVLLRIASGEIAAQAYQAQAAYNNAKLQYDRIKQLYDEKASTQMEMDQATLGLETAEAGLKAARAMESYTTITAPIAGQIVEKRINLGEMAMPGQPVLRIEDNRNLRLEVTVKEQDILNIRPGGAARVQIDAMPGKMIAGRVAQIVQASDVRTHSFTVKVDIPSEKGLITGMYGRAEFTIGEREAITVPKGAVVELSGIAGVYIVTAENRAAFQMVQLGDEHDGSVEVLTGLKTGDRVIADGRLGRIEGRSVSLAGSGN